MCSCSASSPSAPAKQERKLWYHWYCNFRSFLFIKNARSTRLFGLGHTELLVVYPAEDIVLIQPLEQCIKLRRSFRRPFIFTLFGVKLPSVFRGAFFVDKFRKFSFSCSCRVGNTAQLLEQYLIQYHLTESVRRAFIFCMIAVMRAVEGIAFQIIRTLMIKIQLRAAVGTEQQTGILTCFTCACRSAFPWRSFCTVSQGCISIIGSCVCSKRICSDESRFILRLSLYDGTVNRQFTVLQI